MLFSSKNIPQLDRYSMQERHQILSIAGEKLTTPEKLIINIIKLCVLIPPFIMFARLEGLMLLLPIILLIAAYLLVMRPCNLFFQKKHITNAIAQFEKHSNKIE